MEIAVLYDFAHTLYMYMLSGFSLLASRFPDDMERSKAIGTACSASALGVLGMRTDVYKLYDTHCINSTPNV